MKRFLAMISLVILVTFAATAESGVSEARRLIKQGIGPNRDAIESLLHGMSEDQKDTLYATTRDNGVKAFIINAVLPFGIGSYIQGDSGTGTLITILDVTGLGLFTVGAVSMAIGVVSDYSTPGAGGLTGGGTLTGTLIYGVCMLVGGGVTVGGTVVALVAPWKYAKKHNAELTRLIYGSKTAILSEIEPYLAMGPTGPECGIRLAFAD